MFWPQASMLSRQDWWALPAWDDGPPYGELIEAVRPALRAALLLGGEVDSIDIGVGVFGSPTGWVSVDAATLELTAQDLGELPSDGITIGLSVSPVLDLLGTIDDDVNGYRVPLTVPDFVSDEVPGESVPEAITAAVDAFVTDAVNALAPAAPNAGESPPGPRSSGCCGCSTRRIGGARTRRWPRSLAATLRPWPWTRLRALGMTEGLEARVADPLWLLTRQWQVGEFHGEDAAQPAAARVTGRSVPVTSFRAGDGPPRPLNPGVPLEATAESVPAPDFGGGRLHAAVRGGRRLARMLSDAGLDAGTRVLATAYPVAAPQHSVAVGTLGRAAADLLVRHGIDGVALATAPPRRVGELLARVLAHDDLARALTVVDDWRRGMPGGAPGSWDDERLGYGFSVAASGPRGEVTLVAPRHDGGHLDWHTFDLAAGPDAARFAHGLPAAPPRPPRTVAAIPAPVRYTGMPASRFWQFEDARVHFGDIQAGPADLARLLVTEFATVYGDDWFVVPVPVDAGTLTELTAVEVVDTFGGRTAVPSTAWVDTKPGARRSWRLFELSGDEPGDGHPSSWLFVPPTVTGALDGPALERVALARDETANLAWGVEHLVEGPFGRSVDRAEAWGAADITPPRPAATTSTVPEQAWHYRLEATAPPWWVPLLPERVDPRASDGDLAAQVRFRRARFSAWTLLDADQVGPKGALLDPRRPRWFAEEEVPQGGLRVERAWQLARWHDGSVHTWHRWVVTPGRGEVASGVRWDLLGRPGDATA
jgi:hypothetical protein